MLNVKLIRQGRKERYTVRFKYNEELVNKIKEIPKDLREWNNIGKEWFINALGVFMLIVSYKGRDDIFFEFEDNKQREQFKGVVERAKQRIKEKEERKDNLLNHNKEIIEYKNNLPELTKDFDYTEYLKEGIIPMPHQIHSAHFAKKLLSNDYSCLFAMPTGTGKSLSSILTIEMMPEVKKVLYIVPANLRYNIQNEIHKFTNSFCYVPIIMKRKNGERYFQKNKRNEGRDISECKYIAMSYDYFSSTDFDANEKILKLGLHDIDVIIYDEMHLINNKKANRTHNIKRCYDGIVNKYLGLSATPLRGNLKKFFPILKMLKPEEFNNEWDFLNEYAGIRYVKNDCDYYGKWEQFKEPDLIKLNNDLQTLMYRVDKNEVLKDLPPLVRRNILIELNGKEQVEYKQIEKGFAKVDWYNLGLTDIDGKNDGALALLTRLRQFLSKVKTRKTIELVNEMNDYGEKCLVFDQFKDPLYYINDNLEPSSTKLYTGDLNSEEKQDLIDDFQNNNNLKNLLLTIGAGAVGITLTKAQNVIMQGLSLSPDENEQAIARAYRKGQKNTVYAWTLTVADTIDEDIYKIITEKQELFDAVIDGKEYVDTSEDVVMSELLNIIKNKYK